MPIKNSIVTLFYIISCALLLTGCNKEKHPQIYYQSSDNSFTAKDGDLEIGNVQQYFYTSTDCSGKALYFRKIGTRQNWWHTKIILADLNHNKTGVYSTHLDFINSSKLTEDISFNPTTINCIEYKFSYRASTTLDPIIPNHDVICTRIKYNSSTNGYENCNLENNILVLRKES